MGRTGQETLLGLTHIHYVHTVCSIQLAILLCCMLDCSLVTSMFIYVRMYMVHMEITCLIHSDCVYAVQSSIYLMIVGYNSVCM